MEVRSLVVANGEARSSARIWRHLGKGVLTAVTVTTVVAVVVEAVVVVAMVVADEVETALSTKMRLPNNNRTYPVLSANIIRI